MSAFLSQRSEDIKEKDHALNSLTTQLAEAQQRETDIQQTNSHLEQQMAATQNQYSVELNNLQIELQKKIAEVRSVLTLSVILY